MSGRRFIVINVEENRADELISALGKRSYLQVVNLDREERQRLGKCPACLKPFSEEKALPISGKLVEKLVAIAETMKITRSVLLYNSKTPLSSIIEHEHPRCVELDPLSIDYAVNAGLLQVVQDGRHRAFHLTGKALKYLSGESISPSRLIFADGKLVATDDAQTDITKLKIKDRVALDKLVASAKRAVHQIPKPVLDFIENGQVSILI
jgi:hypothetical protein